MSRRFDSAKTMQAARMNEAGAENVPLYSPEGAAMSPVVVVAPEPERA
ncbi:hypothetical protein [Mesobacterium pallidum]|nr:hypothetical protein [Mesobacterium pallidum]